MKNKGSWVTTSVKKTWYVFLGIKGINSLGKSYQPNSWRIREHLSTLETKIKCFVIGTAVLVLADSE